MNQPDHESAPDQTHLSFADRSTGPPPASGAGVRLHLDDEGVGWMVFDLPGEKVNKLTVAVLETLRDLLDEARRKQAKALIFVSDKPDMFVAGADVESFAQVPTAQIAREKAAYGQSVFEAIARFPRTTVAVVTGPCLGGGYEMALAMDRIIVENTPAVRVGLPEVKLGVLPGFGGTQRLPQRTGLRVALDVILAGKTLPAKPAFRRGMADAMVPPGQGRRVAKEFVLGRRKIPRREPGWIDRWIAKIRPVRAWALSQATGALAKKAPRRHYPAPYKALEAISAGFQKGEVAAYGLEAQLLGEALVTDTSRNLTWLFLNSSRAKEPEGLDLGIAASPVRLAVAGAGVMGGGIAWLAGEKGLPIRIKDIAPAALEGALETAGTIWSKQVARRRLTPRDRAERLEKLSFTLDYSGFNTVDFVFEAVVENMDIKHQVIRDLEAVLPPGAVIASNTSSLRIGDIANQAARPERVVGLHFFNPVDRMPLVEVIAGPQSAPWAVATAYKLALRLGKTPILVQDGPGFLVNRLLAFYLGEALALFESGADMTYVDRVLKDFGMPMGPFALLDQIGLDVAQKVTHVMSEAFGERLPPSAVVSRLVSQGLLGKKNGRGFYTYTRSGKQGDPSSEALAGRSGGVTPAEDDLRDRLLLPMVNEAARCLEEGLVSRALDVDLGMVMGTGFPPFRGGLLKWADDRGVETVADRLEVLSQRVDRRFASSPALKRFVNGFYSAAS